MDRTCSAEQQDFVNMVMNHRFQKYPAPIRKSYGEYLAGYKTQFLFKHMISVVNGCKTFYSVTNSIYSDSMRR
jgi:hypothetical protein